MIINKIVKEEKEVEKIDKAFCSFCGNIFDHITTSSGGFGQINISFGYGSCFDDDRFNLEICDDCFLVKYFEMLRKQLKEKGYYIKDLEKKTIKLSGEKQK